MDKQKLLKVILVSFVSSALIAGRIAIEFVDRYNKK